MSRVVALARRASRSSGTVPSRPCAMSRSGWRASHEMERSGVGQLRFDPEHLDRVFRAGLKCVDVREDPHVALEGRRAVRPPGRSVARGSGRSPAAPRTGGSRMSLFSSSVSVGSMKTVAPLDDALWTNPWTRVCVPTSRG